MSKPERLCPHCGRWTWRWDWCIHCLALISVVLLMLVSRVAAAQTGGVLFDHPWTGAVELKLRELLASGLAGADGSNGQAVVNAMNGLGGIYAGGEFQPHHNGVGQPTYGFGWFYVSYIPLSAGGGPIPNDGSGRSYYQIVENGTPPPGNFTPPPPPPPPPPPVDQPPPLDLSSLARYDQVERVFANVTAQINQTNAKVDAVDAKLQAHINEPSMLQKVFTNPAVLSAIIGIVAGHYALPAK